MALTGRAAALGAVGVLVLLLVPSTSQTLLVIDAAIVVLAIVDFALAARVRAVVLRRSGPASVRLGEPLEIALQVVNTDRRTMRLRIRDAWPPSAGSTPRVHAVTVPAGERRRVVTRLQPTRRGDRHAERITVRSLGPLGLAGRQGRHAVPWTVRVLPPFTSRKFLPERLDRLRQLDGALLVKGRGLGTEFDSLRDFVDGDDVRSIDWRATARRSDLVVRTWRPERDRRVVLCVDTGRTSAGRVGDAPRLDHALDAALLLAALASKAGNRVDFLAHDRTLRAAVRSGRSDVLPLLVGAMAPLESVLLEPDHGRLVAEILRRERRRSLVVMFTDLNAAAMEEGLLPAVAPLLHRHALVVASVADPRTEVLRAGRGTAEAVYAAAAAEQAAADRRRVTATLRGRGIEVVDAPPATFAPAVADAYLTLKAAGRL